LGLGSLGAAGFGFGVVVLNAGDLISEDGHLVCPCVGVSVVFARLILGLSPPALYWTDVPKRPIVGGM
jgi:hypothetical protein